MKIHLCKKKNKYAQVHENLLRNPDVSLKAKGLGAWLELHENGFILNLSFILQSTKEGKEAINNAISELKKPISLTAFNYFIFHDDELLKVLKSSDSD